MKDMVKIVRSKARKAFYPSKIPGSRYVVNQYIGCEHACMYCYARFVCKWYDYGEWGTWVIVKENMPELAANKFVEGKVYMSSISDPYQPVERKLELTRRILKNMDKNIELVILTKSSLVLRDVDVLKGLKYVKVGLTINGFKDSIKKVVEPFSSSYKERIKTLENLHNNGIETFAFVSPIIPGLVDVDRVVEETRSFVEYYWFEFLNLGASGRKFRKWLRENRPESYQIVSNSGRFKAYVDEAVGNIRKKGVSVKGIATHYPRYYSS